MEQPTYLYILGEKYSLKHVSGLQDEGCDGKCSISDKIISIDSEHVGTEYYYVVLGHEMMHAYLYESGLHYLIDERTEEAISDMAGKLLKGYKKTL